MSAAREVVGWGGGRREGRLVRAWVKKAAWRPDACMMRPEESTSMVTWPEASVGAQRVRVSANSLAPEGVVWVGVMVAVGVAERVGVRVRLCPYISSIVQASPPLTVCDGSALVDLHIDIDVPPSQGPHAQGARQQHARGGGLREQSDESGVDRR